jgi:hypothetical protein
MSVIVESKHFEEPDLCCFVIFISFPRISMIVLNVLTSFYMKVNSKNIFHFKKFQRDF